MCFVVFLCFGGILKLIFSRFLLFQWRARSLVESRLIVVTHHMMTSYETGCSRTPQWKQRKRERSVLFIFRYCGTCVYNWISTISCHFVFDYPENRLETNLLLQMEHHPLGAFWPSRWENRRINVSNKKVRRSTRGWFDPSDQPCVMISIQTRWHLHYGASMAAAVVAHGIAAADTLEYCLLADNFWIRIRTRRLHPLFHYLLNCTAYQWCQPRPE